MNALARLNNQRGTPTRQVEYVRNIKHAQEYETWIARFIDIHFQQ